MENFELRAKFLEVIDRTSFLNREFQIDYDKLGKDEFNSIAAQITQEEIDAEKQKNAEDFQFIGEVDEQLYNNSIKTDLTVKKWIENNNLNALTINFFVNSFFDSVVVYWSVIRELEVEAVK